MNILGRDKNRFDRALDTEPKHFASAKVIWIIVVKNNKCMTPYDCAEDAGFLIIARCMLDDLFHEGRAV